MKNRVVIFLTVILGIVVISPAQESETNKTFQKKKFNTETITDATEYFVISSKIESDTSEIKTSPF